jgi:hypothetical protein
VRRWLSAARLAKYSTAAGGDIGRALALYEWNSRISAALMRDLGHIEVGLRNAYAAVIERYWAGSDRKITALAGQGGVASRVG